MAELKINSETTDHLISGEKLWIDESGEKVVPDGHPSAAVLFATEGTEISREDAVKYGLVKPTAEEKKAAAAADEEGK